MIHLVERHGPQETEKTEYAGVAELADAQASGACGRKIVWVQVPSPALFFYLREALILQRIPVFFYAGKVMISVTQLFPRI